MEHPGTTTASNPKPAPCGQRRTSANRCTGTGAFLSDDTPKRVKVRGFGGVEGTPALHIQHGVVKLLNLANEHGDELPQHARCQKLARQLGKGLVDQGLGVLPKGNFKSGRNRHAYCPRTVTVMSPTSKVAT